MKFDCVGDGIALLNAVDLGGVGGGHRPEKFQVQYKRRCKTRKIIESTIGILVSRGEAPFSMQSAGVENVTNMIGKPYGLKSKLEVCVL